ncbi:hypothetical protein OSB04_009694 [Centaurea solstitialis]|uniref:Uncharacterized protein n=1 Tax=Centaurea solstitialis TaxID=347529 RepID=A0AA38WJX9_9ASTR|nr:hypothetical protein OSB04_009694 [Centaurea solstitialis]
MSGCVGRREDSSDRDIENRAMRSTGVDFTGEGRGHGRGARDELGGSRGEIGIESRFYCLKGTSRKGKRKIPYEAPWWQFSQEVSSETETADRSIRTGSEHTNLIYFKAFSGLESAVDEVGEVLYEILPGFSNVKGKK